MFVFGRENSPTDIFFSEGGVFIFFRSQFGCFHFSVFRLDKVVLVNFGRKNLFWSNLVPAGFEPGTFGVTATNVIVLTNGPRLHVCVLFLQVKYWSLRDSNLGPLGIGVTATNVTVSNNGPRSQVKPGYSGPLAFFFQPTFFFTN